MTFLADWIFDAICAHDYIATVAIMAIVLGIVVLWLVGLKRFLMALAQEHPRDEQQRVMGRHRVAHRAATVVPITAEPSRTRRELTASGARTTGAPGATSEAVTRARLTVALLPERWSKGA